LERAIKNPAERKLQKAGGRGGERFHVRKETRQRKGKPKHRRIRRKHVIENEPKALNLTERKSESIGEDHNLR